MKLPDFSILRPVTTVMVIVGVVLFGFVSLRNLPQELFPPISYPKLTVVTTYENAAPEEVETLITRIIEEAAGTVSGVRKITSSSKEGLSLVIAEFGWNQDMDFAALGVREKIDLIKERLPRGSEEPVVMKFNPYEKPVMILSLTGEEDLVKLRHIAEKKIKDELEKIDGVASASVSGGLEREIQVNIDQGMLHARSVAILDVSKALGDANLNYPGGTIKESFYEYLVRTLGEFQHLDEIKKIPVDVDERTDEQQEFLMQRDETQGKEAKRLILLEDVATVTDGIKERSSYSRYNAEENVSITIQKQAMVNTIRVIEQIKETLIQLREELPKNIKIDIVTDQSAFIKDSINGVRDAAVQGGFLAFLVLLFFLRNLRSSAIVTFSIPISIMVAFTFMFFGNLSINMMSLGGLALGIGMLVDNAVVVIENIFRRQEEGEDEKEAAKRGAGEVSNAVTASTLTTIAVFLPIGFVVGIAGQIFKQLAFTVTFSLVASLLVALTLIPLLASIRKKASSTSSQAKKSKILSTIEELYARTLPLFLKMRGIGLGFVFIAFVMSLLLFVLVDKELMPKADQGQFMVRAETPTGTRLEITDRLARRIEDHILDYGEIDSINSMIGSTKGKGGKEVLERLGSHQAQILVSLKERRRITTEAFIQKLQRSISALDLGEVKLEYVVESSVIQAESGGAAGPVTLEIKGEDLFTIKHLALTLQKKMASIQGLFDIKNNIIDPSPETKIRVLKDKASLYGLSVVDIAQTSQIAVEGYVTTKYKEKGDEIDVRVQLREEDRDDYAKLRNIVVHSPLGIDVPLAEVAYFVRGSGPTQIDRIDQERTVILSANVFKRPLKDVIADVKALIASSHVPSGYTVKMTGETEEMKESFASLRFALILSILLVYMIMASQFESLIQPFIIMFTLPLSLIGVAWALFLTHTSLNVVVLLGVIMLGGIVVNNGIVLVDYINILRSHKMAIQDAVIHAGKARLRPILMTALTTILGLLPMALAIGKGSELRSPLAISVMGGLLVATFLTIFIIPAIYIVVEDIAEKVRSKK
jgi:HAE1 family hydrophobic/amphiphilic exporter-1